MPTDHVTIKVDDAKVLEGLDRLERVELTHELEEGMRAIADLGSKLVSAKVPRRTGRLAASWKPKVTVHGGEFATIEAAAELQPQAFYGRFQDTGWRYHPQGLHFIDRSERELEPAAARVANELVKRAIRRAGF
jgi:hypothetical protein